MGVDACGFFKPNNNLKAKHFIDQIKKHFYPQELNCSTEKKEKYDVTIEDLFEDNTDGTVGINFGLARYYGPGYARGPGWAHITIIEWLRRSPDVFEVYYYGDCDDPEDATPWTEQDTQKYLNTWFTSGHATYWRD